MRIVESDFNDDLQAAIKAVHDIDLNRFGSSALPLDIRTSSSTTKARMVLQVISCTDSRQPLAMQSVLSSSSTSAGTHRQLVLVLTDGSSKSSTCKAIEHMPIPHLPYVIPPGTKVAIEAGTMVKQGVMLLDPRSIKMLGGRVEALAAPWEMERLYQGIDRPSRPEDAPPPFCHYSLQMKKGSDSKFKGQTPHHSQDINAADQKRGLSANTGEKGQPSIVKAALMSVTNSHMSVLRAGGGGEEASGSNEQEEGEKRTVDVAPASMSFAKGGGEAAKKLLEQMQSREGERGSGRFGRGGGGGRRGRRRGRHDDDNNNDDGGHMTLEEYEAKKEEAKRVAMASALTSTPKDQMDADEELARKLQEQMMIEERDERERMAAVRRFDRPLDARQHRPSTGQQHRTHYTQGVSSSANEDPAGGNRRYDRGRGGRGHGRGNSAAGSTASQA